MLKTGDEVYIKAKIVDFYKDEAELDVYGNHGATVLLYQSQLIPILPEPQQETRQPKQRFIPTVGQRYFCVSNTGDIWSRIRGGEDTDGDYIHFEQYLDHGYIFYEFSEEAESVAIKIKSKPTTPAQEPRSSTEQGIRLAIYKETPMYGNMLPHQGIDGGISIEELARLLRNVDYSRAEAIPGAYSDNSRKEERG